VSNKSIEKIVIVGGGSSGWMTAAALSCHLPSSTKIELVESDEIATVGVGEATIPAIRTFNKALGIDEPEFMRVTNATFKLGIRFENWGKIGDAYNHAFGHFGNPINGVSFHNYWHKMQHDENTGSIHEYNLPNQASESGKFSLKQYNNDAQSRYFYAFQFDAGLYARYLRTKAEKSGVVRTEGKIVTVSQDNESGFIQSVTLESGETIEGDLFIDCSGFRALLIEKTLKVGYQDWSHYLPVNSAWAVSSAYPSEDAAIPPYTRARALTAGWQWRIPLQNRTGDGNVFSNGYISEDEAHKQLLDNLEGKPLSDPRLIKFTTGKREKLWHKNCVSIGLSSGFLEPLESTSLYLIQATILQLIKSFPSKDFDVSTENEFNERMQYNYKEARDFLILHYKATEREDTEFWKYCKNMEIPQELKHRMDLFKERGYVSYNKTDLFSEHSWLAVYFGQGIIPNKYDPRVDNVSKQEIARFLASVKDEVRESVNSMSTHNEMLAGYCAGDLISNNK